MKKMKKVKNDIDEIVNGHAYIIVCQYAISMIELKLKMLQEEMTLEYKRNVISTISSRIKTAESIKRKLIRKNQKQTFQKAQEKLNDLVGVRATFFFEDDIYELVNRLSKQQDVKIIKRKDYIKNPKDNGYKSYHLIVDIPIYDENGCTKLRVEIQLRTVAMDFWAQLDYQLCYKKDIDEQKNIKIFQKLADYAKAIADMDKNMQDLRKQIESL